MTDRSTTPSMALLRGVSSSFILFWTAVGATYLASKPGSTSALDLAFALGLIMPGVAAAVTARGCRSSFAHSLVLGVAAIVAGAVAAFLLQYINLLWMSAPAFAGIESEAAEEAAKKAFDPAHHIGWVILHQVAPVFGFTSLIGGLIGLWFGRNPAERFGRT